MNEPPLLQGVSMCGSDSRMDQRGVRTPINTLPVKCKACGLPDLDFVPEPYYLGKGLSNPAEMHEAEMGNLLVRSRIKEILETVASGQCKFYQTHAFKTKEPTDWFLAVPQNQVVTGTLKKSVALCPECGEPLHAHGTNYQNPGFAYSIKTPFDIFKSKNWISSADKPLRDFSYAVDKREALEAGKNVYFSTRLVLLFKKIGARGLCQGLVSPEKPDAMDHQWVNDSLQRLPKTKGEGVSLSHDQWLDNYIKQKRRKALPIDFTKIEKALGAKLPESYKTFISRMGAKKFRDVDGEDGFNVFLVPPENLNRKKIKAAIRDDPAKTGRDGIIFAETEFGDLFSFKVAASKDADYEVYRYDHEMMDFEPYSRNFAACIRAWAKK